MNNIFYNLYFKNSFSNFCLICGKNSNNLSCKECNSLIQNININHSKLSFFKQSNYWMKGENKDGEKIMSYGLYCIQRFIPINTQEIIKYIKSINFIKKEDNFYHIEIKTISNKNLFFKIPKVKDYYEHYISYQNLFLYPELEKKFSLHISSKKFTRNL